MLNMRIVRAPLLEEEYRAILLDYNRLTHATIPMNEFLHWLQDSPDGPAWHAVLQTDEGRVVGHTSVLPLRARYGQQQLIAGMSEYSVVHEDFRKLKIRGFANVSKPAFIILLDQLFQHCQKQGWGPIFASTNDKNQIFTRKVGLRPLEFPLTECLLILKPSNAARYTPNLSRKQRVALYVTGIAQSGLWSIARHISSNKNGVHAIPIGSESIWPEPDQLSFYEEADSLRWRYLENQYIHYAIDGSRREYAIAKRGRKDRYLRVCQYRLSAPQSLNSLVRLFIDQAKSDNAMGIRWAVYDRNDCADQVVKRLRQMGFLCARRLRIVMVHKDFPNYLQPAVWCMNDAHFCLDP